MKIVKFLGGLGNQMFQYAFYRALQQRFKNVKADLSGFENYKLHQGFELERVFGVQIKSASPFEIRIYDNGRSDFVTRKLRRLFGTKRSYHQEKRDFAFEADIFPDKSSKYYWGYWQNLNYFKAIEEQLKTEFIFKSSLRDKNLDLLKLVGSQNSVSLHVRRGDYLTDPYLSNVCDLAYFDAAIHTIQERVPSPTFFVFSNDINWCKENLNLNNAIYVDWNSGEDSYCDMQLMSECKHNIISNSSFSWWAAWLNNNADKIVIAPKRWMNIQELDYSGILPDEWTKL